MGFILKLEIKQCLLVNTCYNPVSFLIHGNTVLTSPHTTTPLQFLSPPETTPSKTARPLVALVKVRGPKFVESMFAAVHRVYQGMLLAVYLKKTAIFYYASIG